MFVRPFVCPNVSARLLLDGLQLKFDGTSVKICQEIPHFLKTG